LSVVEVIERSDSGKQSVANLAKADKMQRQGFAARWHVTDPAAMSSNGSHRGGDVIAVGKAWPS
jgi:hypothetical protein